MYTLTCLRRMTPLVAFAVLVFLIPVATYGQVGVIEKEISGPGSACVNQSVSYDTYPQTCADNFWKITYNGQVIFEYAKFDNLDPLVCDVKKDVVYLQPPPSDIIEILVTGYKKNA